MPAAHRALGEAIAETIQPLDANGQPDPVNGRIVMTSIGASLTRGLFTGQAEDEGPVTYPGAFKPRADADPDKHAQLVIVNGAIGSMDMDRWLADDPASWNTVIDEYLPAAGVTALQVQTAWLMLLDRADSSTAPFPDLQSRTGTRRRASW